MRRLGREMLDDAKPDAVIVVGSDHLETFFLSAVPTFALIGGVRIDDLRITNNSFDTTGAEQANFPVSKSWTPVSYRAAATWEPIEKMVFYGL